MDKYPRHVSVDLKQYKADVNDPETFYGLPQNVEFCESCVISNQRPEFRGRVRAHQGQQEDDHPLRRRTASAMPAASPRRSTTRSTGTSASASCRSCATSYRRNDGHYDCLVPGSGGKDSFYASHVLKHKFGMHPLTVHLGAAHLHGMGLEELPVLDPRRLRQLPDDAERAHAPPARRGWRWRICSIRSRRSCSGRRSLAPKMALLHDIPLVFYGENEAEYGNPIGDTDTAKRDWSLFHRATTSRKIYLGGVSVARPEQRLRRASSQDLLPYLPADPDADRAARRSRCTISAII